MQCTLPIAQGIDMKLTEYVCDIWIARYLYEYAEWTSLTFSHLKVFPAETAEKALEDANKYVKQYNSRYSRGQIKNIRKI